MILGFVLGAVFISLIWLLVIGLCLAAAERDTFDEMNTPPTLPGWAKREDDAA